MVGVSPRQQQQPRHLDTALEHYCYYYSQIIFCHTFTSGEYRLRGHARAAVTSSAAREVKQACSCRGDSWVLGHCLNR